MLFLTLTLTQTLFLKHNFTNVVYYRKHHCLPSKNVHIGKFKAMSLGRGWGIEGLYAHYTGECSVLQATSNSATADRIEDILSGTMPPKRGICVGYIT